MRRFFHANVWVAILGLSCLWTEIAGAEIAPTMIADWCKQDGKAAEDADDAYLKACKERRDARLKTLKETFPKIVFTKHFDLGGSHYAYTEAQSDAQAERNFVPGSALCLLELKDGEYETKTLISDPNGVIRDPAVTFDGKKIVFAWKKSDRLDDYHLYDYEVETGEIRQLTFGLGYADYEPCPLPGGDIVFNSTRCVQVVDCWWTEVSNLYRCDGDGNFLRRLSFDQVHTNYPSILEDGRVVYTRWDYNDRGQIFPQGLFQMNADGSAQTEFYGNNSWFPTTLMHTRGIPGSSGKAVTVFSGHHNRQYGKLGIVDTTKGRQENSGTQLIAPIRENGADRIDAWGQWGDRFSHPYPINEREFIVAYNDQYTEPGETVANEGIRHQYRDHHTVRTPFGLYWMDADGNRELLAFDPEISCNQPFPLTARKAVPIRDSVGNPEDNPTGTYTMQDVYFGPGMEGVERGTAKTLRVIALDFRSVGIGSNSNGGPSGGAMVSTPVSISHGTWDVKIPLGDVPIEADGSASFIVPARTPVYFQVLDENGHCIQTMRSWTTLQPGETFSCIGCHEDKNITAQPAKVALAQRQAPKELKPFYGETRGFSFAKEIQPILDKHCIQCHHDDSLEPSYRDAGLHGKNGRNGLSRKEAGKLVSTPILKNGESWHYTTETPPPNWMKTEYFEIAQKLPLSQGAFGSMPGKNLGTEWKTSDLWIWTTVDLPKNWTSRPLMLRHFHDEDVKLYVNGREIFSEKSFNADYDHVLLDKRATAAFKPGKNYLAAHVIQTGGGQGVDIGLWNLKPGVDPFRREGKQAGGKPVAFSLKDDPVLDEIARRYWSRSYLNLTNSRPDPPHPDRPDEKKPYLGRQTPIVDWINVQDVPSMLPPYKAGAARSGIMKMFDPNLSPDGKTHQEVKLSREELDKLACWIDLLVPFCGDYFEANAWNEFDLKKFEYYENKKREMNELERGNFVHLALYRLEGDASAKSNAAPKTDNPYRNLALNPGAKDAPEGETPSSYPAASSNSVYHDAPEFAASNCIDGKLENTGHGTNFPSWGPEQNVGDLWWKVDFGRNVRTDQVAITIRADFPHDTYWKECTIECSNGFKRKIDLQKTADRQIFRFPPQRIEWLKLTGFKAESEGWAALSEVEVFGVDSVPRSYIAPGTEEK